MHPEKYSFMPDEKITLFLQPCVISAIHTERWQWIFFYEFRQFSTATAAKVRPSRGSAKRNCCLDQQKIALCREHWLVWLALDTLKVNLNVAIHVMYERQIATRSKGITVSQKQGRSLCMTRGKLGRCWFSKNWTRHLHCCAKITHLRTFPFKYMPGITLGL